MRNREYTSNSGNVFVDLKLSQADDLLAAGGKTSSPDGARLEVHQ